MSLLTEENGWLWLLQRLQPYGLKVLGSGNQETQWCDRVTPWRRGFPIRDTFSKLATNDWRNMPLLTELENGWLWLLQRLQPYGLKVLGSGNRETQWCDPVTHGDVSFRWA